MLQAQAEASPFSEDEEGIEDRMSKGCYCSRTFGKWGVKESLHPTDFVGSVGVGMVFPEAEFNGNAKCS